jgi:small subunit ribosomal protein S17
MAENEITTSEAPPTVAPESRGRRKERVGKVVSDKMQKTVVVSLTRQVPHPLYKKYFKKTTKFVAHDEKNDAKTGDTVRIMETRPLSKTKRWRVIEVLERAK